ncbi:hypothetical protein C0995_015465 [Termitomyces sp. Mi166|nr:hypothetical protein C0995_015465 [Termitomyces sp. Mi166\
MPDLFGGRNYDYTKIYSPEKPGEEAKENARVWKVYLDEAENYDADMIQGFRNIIDGLLVFAALFSAVVSTFVAQPSQALQPDNTQIIASLLFETNQLLRAAGNRSNISAVPVTSLIPGSRTYTSLDAWVNGLFFTSLALSLSTALLTVLAKQWIQAYTAIVPGGAKTRALIRHFRFQGLTKWKLGNIIESLPMILHSSVAIFLVGLALYVSQLSTPICWIISVIAALTFLFYIGSSILPAFDIACPYRIAFMFSVAQPLVFALRMTRYAFSCLWYGLHGQKTLLLWPRMSKTSLKRAEHSEVFEHYYSPNDVIRITYDSFDWVISHSSNHSAKEVVVEGACGLLNDSWTLNLRRAYDPRPLILLSSKYNKFFLLAVTYSLSQLPDMSSTFTTKDEVENSTFGRLIGNLMKIFYTKSLLDPPIALNWQEQIEDALLNAYTKALRRKYRALAQCILDWTGPNLLQSQSQYCRKILFSCAENGDGEDIHDLVDRGMDLNHRDSENWTAVHYVVDLGNLSGVLALVEREPALMSIITNPPRSATPLDLAFQSGNSDIVACLLDHGADPPSNALHQAVWWYQNINLGFDTGLPFINVLLDRGWDRTAEDEDGRTPIDIARTAASEYTDKVTVADHLEHYQTVRFRPYTRTSPTPNERAP